MSLSKKIIYSILVAVALGLVLFSSIWLGKNYGKIKQALDGVSLYTSEDLDKAYNDGKEDGLKEKQTYLQLIEDYKLEILDVESKLTDKSNAYNKLESQYFSAVSDRDNYKSLLDTTTEERDNLQIEYDSAVLRCENLSEQLTLLQNEIDELSLNLTNAKHRIAELESNVNSNDEILDSMVSENQVIARFYVKNIVYSIQVLDKSSIATVSEPVMSENEIFLGWTIDNEVVDVSTYPITENTVFVAKINDIFDVNFVSDDVNLGNYKVISGCYSDVPENPTKDGYEFDGWSVDNMVVDVSIYPITSDITFVAKFTKIHTVTFEFKGQVDSTQKVRNGGYASSYTPTADDCRINYWTLNGVKVDVDTYCITSDTTFVCNYTNIYKVKFVAESEEVIFDILDNEYPSRSAVENDLSSYFSRDNYVFDYWMNESSVEVDPFTTPVTSNVTYTAHFSRLWTVRFLVDNNVVSTQTIKNNEYAEYVVVESTDRKEFKSWTAYGSDINVSSYRITEDVDFEARVVDKYLVQFKLGSYIIENQYVETSTSANLPNMNSYDTFSVNGWNLDGSIVDVQNTPINNDTLFIADYEYNLNEILDVSFNNVPSNFLGQYVWNWKDKTYFSYEGSHYYLDIYTKTWIEKTWNGFSDFSGTSVWNDGNKVYISIKNIGQYVLDENSDTWIVNDWKYKYNKPFLYLDNYYFEGGYQLKVFNIQDNILYDLYLYDENNNYLSIYKYYEINGNFFGYLSGNNKFYKLNSYYIDSNKFVVNCSEVTFSGIDETDSEYSFYTSSALKNIHYFNGKYFSLFLSYTYEFNIETLTFSSVIISGIDENNRSGYLDDLYFWTDGLYFYFGDKVICL